MKSEIVDQQSKYHSHFTEREISQRTSSMEKDSGQAVRYSEDRIDLIDLIQHLWDHRYDILKILMIFLGLGIVIILASRVEYQASATLLPEAEATDATANNLLQQYGGLFGLGSGSITGGATLSPNLYPNIVASLPYQAELMNKPINFSKLDTVLTPHEYFQKVQSPSLSTILKKYSIGLPAVIYGWFSNSAQKPDDAQLLSPIDRDSVIRVTQAQMKTINELRERIKVSQEEGIITLTAEFTDPLASAEIAHAGISLLKEYVKEYRTKKALNKLQYVEEQVESSRKKFEEAQNRLAEFRDSNLNLATAKARTREQELQSQYDLAFNVYNSLTQKLEQARLQVQEDTPVFTIVEPIRTPLGKSSPRAALILSICIILGFMAGIGWVIVTYWWKLITESRLNSFS